VDIMSNYAQSVFIRNTNDDAIDLHKYKRIAIYYSGEGRIDPKYYEDMAEKQSDKKIKRMYQEEAKALKIYEEIKKDGAYIFASYKSPYKNVTRVCLAGKIAPGTPIQACLIGNWYRKEMQMSNCKDISFSQCPVLFGKQPMSGTIRPWPIAHENLKSYVEGQPLSRVVGSLHPSHLEVICYEYLRDHRKIDRLIMPIGGTMMHVDIWGINKNGEDVIAQVTHSTNNGVAQSKANQLVNVHKQLNSPTSGSNIELYLFCPKNAGNINNNSVVNVVRTEDVFAHFDKNGNSIMLDRMLRI